MRSYWQQLLRDAGDSCNCGRGRHGFLVVIVETRNTGQADLDGDLVVGSLQATAIVGAYVGGRCWRGTEYLRCRRAVPRQVEAGTAERQVIFMTKRRIQR